MKNFAKFTLLSTLLIAFAFTLPITSDIGDNSEKTKEVVDRHLAAFGERNVDKIMEDYTDKSILISPMGVHKGLGEIRKFMEEALPMFPLEGTKMEIDRMEFVDDVGFITWHAKTPTMEVPFGTDTFIVKKGKIIRQTFAAVMK